MEDEAQMLGLPFSRIGKNLADLIRKYLPYQKVMNKKVVGSKRFWSLTGFHTYRKEMVSYRPRNELDWEIFELFSHLGI